MRIECAWCRKQIGEKCPFCGSEKIERRTAGRCYKEHFVCECGEYFTIGEGDAPSSTICEACRNRLAEDEAVQQTARGSR